MSPPLPPRYRVGTTAGTVAAGDDGRFSGIPAAGYITLTCPDTVTPAASLIGQTVGSGNTSPLLQFSSTVAGTPTHTVRYEQNYRELILSTTSPTYNVGGVENLDPAGYAAYVFRGPDPKYPAKGSFEHMAIGWGNNLNFNYIESSSYDGTANPLMPPSRFVIQQTGGVDPTGGIGLLFTGTIGTTAVTVNAATAVNGMLVTGAGIPPLTTVVSGGGTTSLVLSNALTSTLSAAFVTVSTPTYGQRTVMDFDATTSVKIYNWDGTTALNVNRSLKFVGINSGTNNLRNALDVYGGGTFGATTASRNSAGIVGVVTVFDPSATPLRLSRTSIGTVDFKVNGASSAAYSLDVVDTDHSSVIPLSLPMDGSATVKTGGGLIRKARVITAAGAVTVATSDDVVIVNKTTGTATAVSLPASPDTGRQFVIKDGKGDAATNNITITPAAGNIDGSATLVLSTNYQAVRLIYNGTQWNVL